MRHKLLLFLYKIFIGICLVFTFHHFTLALLTVWFLSCQCLMSSFSLEWGVVHRGEMTTANCTQESNLRRCISQLAWSVILVITDYSRRCSEIDYERGLYVGLTYSQSGESEHDTTLEFPLEGGPLEREVASEKVLCRFGEEVFVICCWRVRFREFEGHCCF